MSPEDTQQRVTEGAAAAETHVRQSYWGSSWQPYVDSAKRAAEMLLG